MKSCWEVCILPIMLPTFWHEPPSLGKTSHNCCAYVQILAIIFPCLCTSQNTTDSRRGTQASTESCAHPQDADIQFMLCCQRCRIQAMLTVTSASKALNSTIKLCFEVLNRNFQAWPTDSSPLPEKASPSLVHCALCLFYIGDYCGFMGGLSWVHGRIIVTQTQAIAATLPTSLPASRHPVRGHRQSFLAGSKALQASHKRPLIRTQS